MKLRRIGKYAAVLLVLASATPAFARDAAFMDPGAGGASDQAIKVEPKEELDTGETVLNVAKRAALFFVNQTNQPIKIEKVTANSDGNVTAEVTNDDCSKQGTLTPLSRCSIEVSVTPTSPGPWNVDVLMTHDGPGRITRAKVTGKTSGSTSVAERKDMGLALSTKEAAPVTFGDVAVDTGKAVRSALMVNDSLEPITIYSIDVIAADNGLQRLDQGCAVDMELKPGESCPVTLVWTPTENGQISTDLIIRHSGKLGFAVIPIRGNAQGGKDKDKSKSNTVSMNSTGKGSISSPPSPADLERAAVGKVLGTTPKTEEVQQPKNVMRLIGTVGNRAVLLITDGTTAVVGAGEEFDTGEKGKKGKVVYVGPKSADIVIDDKKQTLALGAAPELTAKATQSHESSSSGVPGSGTGAAASGGVASSGGNFGAGLTPVQMMNPSMPIQVPSSAMAPQVAPLSPGAAPPPVSMMPGAPK